MAKATEFEISVQSDDPKKKDQPEDKDKAEGSSKQSKNGKKASEEEGEELVGNLTILGRALSYLMFDSQKKIFS